MLVCRRLAGELALLVLIGLGAAACGSTSTPSDDRPPPPLDQIPPDGNDASGADAAAAPNIYTGTCLEAVAACFDLMLPCMQTPFPSMPGFTATSSNGATYVANLAQGTATATSSMGVQCWTSSTDPATSDILYSTPQGMIRERVDPSGRQITCPDGSHQTAPAGDPPWTVITDQCSGPR
jgi:hypothetical protein